MEIMLSTIFFFSQMIGEWDRLFFPYLHGKPVYLLRIFSK